MPTSVTMPALGESVTEGTVTRWLKQEGDTVEADEPLLEVSTDKVDTEIPSPASGVILKIVAAEDDEVEVGGELAVIGDASEADSAGGGDDSSSASEETDEPEAEKSGSEESKPEAQAESSTSESSSTDSSSKGAASGTEVTLPALGESVTEGTVTQWLKSVGDSVEADEPLLEVSTDKVDTEIPSPASGTLLEIKVEDDETAEVGAVLAIIGSGDAAESKPEPKSEPTEQKQETKEPAKAEEAVAAKAEEAPKPKVDESKAEEAKGPEAPAQSSPPKADVPKGLYVTPLVRKLAGQHGVDLSQVSGTGVGGRIRKEDILAAAEKQAPASSEAEAPQAPTAPAAPSPLRGRTEKMSRLRQVIAQRMPEALHTQAQLTTVVEVDLTKVAKLRAANKDAFAQRNGVKLSFLPFLAVAAIEALQQHPVVNAHIDTEAKTITYPDTENLGIAVDTEKGLLVPVIKNAGDLNLAGISKRVADIADRARNNKLSPDDLSGGTFTLTNTGSRGALFDTPIVNAPQSAILGTGALVKRPMVVNDPELGEIIAVRSMMYLALSYDHRLIDGADAARFLGTMKERLEEGNFEGQLGL
ncbi:2-oxoglutarate dehydrogenase, E2 component, dihydrolipoamide succinyltransferase [Natronoglycomyces albus]|uniref:Dihydrolipoyllysine-residue succinyltransferase n=1 Tax=Natronoglycomyces albus TaxID=2811108 RepID=A0A895XRL9_9ACTN|nr:2-oxoglutarate dehydrogenase, E2 component, dihydrolipoamide succinyltransferase [Natronoglycomyces albus]QSB06352.1 2-oxoglutarate dehydrogenase, E2 component, dihydrolipoamide succinyltransferase [Natronoglycomyces albus]